MAHIFTAKNINNNNKATVLPEVWVASTFINIPGMLVQAATLQYKKSWMYYHLLLLWKRDINQHVLYCIVKGKKVLGSDQGARTQVQNSWQKFNWAKKQNTKKTHDNLNWKQEFGSGLRSNNI